MIWLTLRQFRPQALTAAAAIAATAAYLAVLGTDIRDLYDRTVTDCTSACDDGAARQLIADQFGLTLMLLDGLSIATHRLVWNQSITRRHWLATKLVIVGGASVITVGTMAITLTILIAFQFLMANAVRPTPIEPVTTPSPSPRPSKTAAST